MECSTIDTYRSLESDRIYNDATLLESIFKDAANDQLDQDDVLHYIEQFQLQIIAPLVCIAICLVTLIVLSICLCRRVNIRLWDRQKKRCRIFYLISSGLLFICMCMSIYFSESITNSLLKSSCQFEDSRKEAEGLMVNLNTTVVNITENLDIFEKDNKLITLIEWPQLIADKQDIKFITLSFNYLNDLNNRTVDIKV